MWITEIVNKVQTQKLQNFQTQNRLQKLQATFSCRTGKFAIEVSSISSSSQSTLSLFIVSHAYFYRLFSFALLSTAERCVYIITVIYM